MSAILCLFAGHKAPTDPRLAGGVFQLNQVGSKEVWMVAAPCGRCGVMFYRELAEPLPVAPIKQAPDLWPLLLRLAPKAKFGDLADALFEQGMTVDLKLVPRESRPDEPCLPAEEQP